MSLHHPPLLTFDESLASGARLYLRQQDALGRAAEATGVEPDVVARAIDTYLRRMTETEIRRGPRRAADPTVAPGQTKVEDMPPADDGPGDDNVEDPLAA
jgi:hypothetical protein